MECYIGISTLAKQGEVPMTRRRPQRNVHKTPDLLTWIRASSAMAGS